MKDNNRYYGFSLVMLLVTFTTMAQEVGQPGIPQSQDNAQEVAQPNAQAEQSVLENAWNEFKKQLQPVTTEAKSYATQQGQQLYEKAKVAAEQQGATLLDRLKRLLQRPASDNQSKSSDMQQEIERINGVVQKISGIDLISAINRGDVLYVGQLITAIRENIENVSATIKPLNDALEQIKNKVDSIIVVIEKAVKEGKQPTYIDAGIKELKNYLSTTVIGNANTDNDSK